VGRHVRVADELPTLAAEIRTAIDDDAKQPHFIKTLHGFGYAFEGDVMDAAGRPLTREAAARLIRPGGDLADRACACATVDARCAARV